MDHTMLLEKCQPLLTAVNDALESRKKKTAIEASAITGGGTLSEASCVDNLLDFEFDSFMGVGGFEDLLGGLFSTLQDDAKDNLKNMACDFADDLKAQSDSFISCTANLSVDLAVAAGMSAPTLESCFGTGMSGSGYDFSFSGGSGSNSIERRLGGDISVGGSNNDSTGSTNSQIDSLMDGIQNKVDDLNSMGGG